MFLRSNLHRLLVQLFVINFDSSDDGRGQIFDECLQFSPHLRQSSDQQTSVVSRETSHFFFHRVHLKVDIMKSMFSLISME